MDKLRYYTVTAAMRAAAKTMEPMLVIIPSGEPRSFMPVSIYSALATDKAVAFVHGNYIHTFDDGR